MQIPNKSLRSEKKSKSFVILTCLFLMFYSSCKQETLPKPPGMLALEYPKADYNQYVPPNCPYTFDKNDIGKVKFEKDCSMIINYPKLNGALYLTYRNVNGDIAKLLTDAQKLTYEHVIKADNIVEQKYLNPDHNVYGMFYDISGNAASQSQFYLTDSISHFITGSIYFNVRPNYDSILPAAAYLKKDIRHLMESLTWKK